MTHGSCSLPRRNRQPPLRHGSGTNAVPHSPIALQPEGRDSLTPSILVEDPTDSMVATRLSDVSLSGARRPSRSQRPLNSSSSAIRFNICAVMVIDEVLITGLRSYSKRYLEKPVNTIEITLKNTRKYPVIVCGGGGQHECNSKGGRLFRSTSCFPGLTGTTIVVTDRVVGSSGGFLCQRSGHHVAQHTHSIHW